jgi:hypothetical protein
MTGYDKQRENMAPGFTDIAMFKLVGNRKFKNRSYKLLVLTSHFLVSVSYDEIFKLLSHTIVCIMSPPYILHIPPILNLHNRPTLQG